MGVVTVVDLVFTYSLDLGSLGLGLLGFLKDGDGDDGRRRAAPLSSSSSSGAPPSESWISPLHVGDVHWFSASAQLSNSSRGGWALLRAMSVPVALHLLAIAQQTLHRTPQQQPHQSSSGDEEEAAALRARRPPRNRPQTSRNLPV